MKTKKYLLAIIIVPFFMSPLAHAEIPFYKMAESDEYSEKSIGMFGRGVTNALTSFVDIFTQTVDKAKQGPPLVGFVHGLGSGTACGLMRIGSGAVDVLSFWVPGYNGAPISRNYHDCLDNDYVPYDEETAAMNKPTSQRMAPTPARRVRTTPASKQNTSRREVKWEDAKNVKRS